MESFAGDVEREVVGVDENFDPADPFGQLVLSKVAGDEHALDQETRFLGGCGRALPVVLRAIVQTILVHWIDNYGKGEENPSEKLTYFRGRKSKL